MVTGYLRRSRPRLRVVGRGRKGEVVTFVEVVLVCEPWKGGGRGRWLPSSKSSSSASRGKGEEGGGGYRRRSRPRLRAVGRGRKGGGGYIRRSRPRLRAVQRGRKGRGLPSSKSSSSASRGNGKQLVTSSRLFSTSPSSTPRTRSVPPAPSS